MAFGPSVFCFAYDNLSKHQWIFNKLGMCIDIVEIWFGIANRQISSFFFTELSTQDTPIFFQRYFTFILQWIAFIFGRDVEEDQ